MIVKQGDHMSASLMITKSYCRNSRLECGCKLRTTYTSGTSFLFFVINSSEKKNWEMCIRVRLISV